MRATGVAPLSIIIPTLNEAASLGRTLANVRALDPPALEVLVVDGGSRDATRAIATAAGVAVISCETAGRAIQMNAGARQARGSLLCFLHADTLVPTDLVAIADRVLEERAIAGAGFVSLMSGEDTTRWGISALNLLKTHLAPLLFRPHLYWRGLRLLFGDQVMICRRQTFWEVGGFNEALPILEDGDLLPAAAEAGTHPADQPGGDQFRPAGAALGRRQGRCDLSINRLALGSGHATGAPQAPLRGHPLIQTPVVG